MWRMIVFVLLLSLNAMAQDGQMPVEGAEISPHAAFLRQQQGALLLDIREVDERTQGMAKGALGVAMGLLQASPEAYLPDLDTPVLLICRSGQRSKKTAAHLLRQGYTQVLSVQGGTLRWLEEELPMTPAIQSSSNDIPLRD